MADAFDEALEDAITEPDQEDELAIDFDDDEPIEAGRQEEHGGDIDEPDTGTDTGAPSHIDHSQSQDAKRLEAEQIKSQWQAEYQQRESELKAAQEKYKEIRKKALNGEEDEEAEIAAQDAAIQARYALEKAQDGYRQAEQYHESIVNAPKLAPAAQAWLDANPAYNSDTKFQSKVRSIMADLKAQGFDSTHQTFYRKIDDQLRKSPRMGQNSRRTPGAPAIRTSKTDRERSEPAITKSEAKFIQRIGRDPSDKRVQAQWRDSKANTRRVAQMRGQI